MRITPDTNVLIRAITRDDAQQSPLAEKALGDADIAAIGLSALCEVAWVLSHGYKTPAEEILHTLKNLTDSAVVVTDQPAVEAGLAMLAAGGDFADGVIAYEGARLGGSLFVTFDKKAARLLKENGHQAHLLS